MMYNASDRPIVEENFHGFVPIIDMNSSFLHESDSDECEIAFDSTRLNFHRNTQSIQDEENCKPHNLANSIMTLGTRTEASEKMHGSIISSNRNEMETLPRAQPTHQPSLPYAENFLCRTGSRASTVKDVAIEGNDDASSCTIHGLTCVPSALSSINNDWDSSSNLENPKNWPLWKRVFHTAIPALYGFVLTVGTSAYVPAIPLIMIDFKVPREIALLPLAFYTYGFTVGPLIYAPLSELYGRRIVYWVSMPLLLSFSAICASANNIAVLIIMRFFASLTGSGALAVGAGTILDLWRPEAQAAAALAFIMAPFLGPCLGPLIGAYVIHNRNNDWRWTIWIILVIAAPIAGMSVFMKETSKSRILYNKVKNAVETKPQKGDTRLFLRKLRQALLKPCHMMLFEPLVALLSIYTGFAFAMLFSFFTSYNFVFLTVYHFDMIKIGTTFLGILLGFLFALVSFSVFDSTLYRRQAIKCNGQPAPEYRLYNAMLGSIMLPIGLFWFAWAPRAEIHWILPTLAGIPFGWGTLSIFISATAYLVEVYQVNSSSVIAANGILRYLLGGSFPLFTLHLYTGLGIHWAGSVFAFLSVILTPVPWIFFWKGRLLRAKSTYDTNSA